MRLLRMSCPCSRITQGIVWLYFVRSLCLRLCVCVGLDACDLNCECVCRTVSVCVGLYVCASDYMRAV